MTDAVEATARLGEWAARLDAARAPEPVLDRLSLVLLDVIGVTALGAGLASPRWDNRLSAMFSTPFAVAAALLHGEVGPRTSLEDPRLRALARRVRLVEADDLTARLPDERAARVTVALADGTTRIREVPNPVGDADHRPLDEREVLALLRRWLPGRGDLIGRAAAFARELPALDHAGERLRELAGGDETKEPK